MIGIAVSVVFGALLYARDYLLEIELDLRETDSALTFSANVQQYGLSQCCERGNSAVGGAAKRAIELLWK